MVKAFRSKMFLYVYVASLKETATHGGAEQQIPPPCCGHNIWFSLYIIRSHHKYRSGIDYGVGSYGFFHGLFSLLIMPFFAL